MTPADTELARPLPPVRGRWRRVWRHRRLMHHNRLAAGVVAVNLVVLADGGWWGDLGTISSMVLANVALAALIRQQYVINAIFLSATSAPVTWPLRVRALLGKVYHVFGGIHVGGMASATGWFLVFAATATVQPVGAAVLVVTYLIAALLLAMITSALPTFRARHHNRFELMHRFGGWGLLALFWLHSLLFSALVSATGPAPILVLLVVSISIALPWLRLRRVPVRISSPSSHVALVRFDYGVTPFAGSSTTVSRSPLREWHSFANVPSPGMPGFRLTISRAGDWTGALIDDRPSHLWVKGIPTAGVGNIDRLFRRVVWVATGSGIGPCLPHLLSRETPSRLVWSTRDPRATYGDDLVEEILAVQPDPVIWDTTALGKPDLVALAYQAYREFDAEAVICISNKKTTWNVVEQLEMRGIPAYGAIWDS
ncbi:hypothetical protein [Myceligenerans pegani]|uniref:Uncharacterized protein n=1 Tax=Myceligenerans pegani TaxID=2776917 RepID=A0ABR9MYK1_9MICO|nr:hypothetical protein [Myceligenerans sp. TRM 65318]MBE1876190.1 hypothetical protein [Myceligenerans sp. TRM 65318]MBE3018461.1 hypothetical protein [Myceligenerans sp. TRM 65318]